MQKKPLPTSVKVLFVLAAVVIIPFALTLRTITQPRPQVTELAANPSPNGYTWSLSLFIVPVVVLGTWVSARKQNPIQKKACWITAVLLTLGGVFLDVFFGLSFFTFVNHEATLGV